ncbi:hypothetical protein M0657_003799 [Pyricularia oryzae]|nr:hypothetical protein M9X92_004813 [Pyricularia oryzae]KAI7926338.1 hypothetical protein M0657_003799 [Pyricularia oryzae]
MSPLAVVRQGSPTRVHITCVTARMVSNPYLGSIHNTKPIKSVDQCPSARYSYLNHSFSKSRMNAQVSFLDGELSLIHIPLNLYPTLLQPILQILLPQKESILQPEDEQGNGSPVASNSSRSWSQLGPHDQRPFLNVSITPIECSVVCQTTWATSVFEPALQKLQQAARGKVSISKESYVALCVISAGMDAGSRVVDLSSPLALAGISIFFITTYYSDFILVPSKDKKNVVQALLARGFEFTDNGDSSSMMSLPRSGLGSYLNSHANSGAGSTMVSRRGSYNEHDNATPDSPLPSNADELQERTFALLKKQSVQATVDTSLRLVHCSGHETSSHRLDGEISAASPTAHLNRPSLSRMNTGNGFSNGHSHRTWVDTVDTRLYTCLVAALATQPKFLSVTLAQDDPPSLLLDKALVPMFGESLIGEAGGELAPIFLDLASLPFEATGIVSGVAGRLAREMSDEGPELSYLSTARAGAVILSREQSAKAIEILGPLLSGDT